MTLKQGFVFFLRQAVWAILVLGVLLMGLEYFLPASVLPFIDLMDLFLFLVVFAILVLSSAISFGKTAWFFQGFIGAIFSGGVLFILWLQTDRFSLKTLLLLACGAGCLISWLLTVFKPVGTAEPESMPEPAFPPKNPMKPSV